MSPGFVHYRLFEVKKSWRFSMIIVDRSSNVV